MLSDSSGGCSQLRNDLGLLAEEYDSAAGRQAGNFPQAFSHVGLINAALNLSGQLVMGVSGDERRPACPPMTVSRLKATAPLPSTPSRSE